MSERYTMDASEQRSLNRYITKCFLTMTFGLLVSALVGYVSYTSGMWMWMYTNMLTMWGTLLFEIGIVIVFSSRLYKMSVAGAYASFFLYAIVSGYTLSSLAVAYDLTSIGLAFGFAAVLFVNLVIIGCTTKRDLMKYSTLLFGGLFTLVLVSILGAFMNVEVLDMVICYVGIAIFLCLTAYDVQMLKRNYYVCEDDLSMQSKMNIYSALELYLDFINIFLYVLRIVGKRD